jgi:hypothetical protein
MSVQTNSNELGNSQQAVNKHTAAACFSEVQVVDKKPTVRMWVGDKNETENS